MVGGVFPCVYCESSAASLELLNLGLVVLDDQLFSSCAVHALGCHMHVWSDLNLTSYYSLRNMQSHILKYHSCRGADLEKCLLKSSGVLSENCFDLSYHANFDFSVKFSILDALEGGEGVNSVASENLKGEERKWKREIGKSLVTVK